MSTSMYLIFVHDLSLTATLCWKPDQPILEMKKLKFGEISIFSSKVSCHYVTELGWTEVTWIQPHFYLLTLLLKVISVYSCPYFWFLYESLFISGFWPCVGRNRNGVTGKKSFAVWQLLQVFELQFPTCPLLPLWGPPGKDAFGTYPGFASQASFPGHVLPLTRTQHLCITLGGAAGPSSFPTSIL